MPYDQKHMSDSEWRRHEKVLEQFESALQLGAAPNICDFLPEESEADHDYRLRELIVIDLEYQCEQSQTACIEDYLERFPRLGDRDTLSLELIEEELRIKGKHDRFPSLDELLRRFPTRADEIEKLVERMRPRSQEKTSNRGSTDTSIVKSTDSRPQDVLSPTEFIASEHLGRYALGEQIGRGAFAVVHRAWDPKLRREVAIKIPRAEFVNDEDSRARMEREAQAAARLKHPGIVQIHEVGSDQDRMYIVYDLVDGPTLQELLRDRKPTLREAATWTIQIAEALHYAHQCGVVHRDIKPANVIMGSEGRPMLADFGLAHQEEDAVGTLTREGDVLGTPAYMSPEQASGMGHRADARSDVYSLGVVLYQLLSGRVPFEGPSTLLLQRIQSENPRLAREIDRDLRTITSKCLEKEPAARYSSAKDLARDLNHFLNGEPIHARPVGWSERIWKWSRRHPQLATLTAAVLLLVGIALGILLQLGTTRSQRDRAVKAEKRAKLADLEKQKLLADSYASAGLLAMQRGRMRDALTYFDRSLEQGYKEPIKLRLKKVAAWVSVRESEMAIKEINALSARQDLNDKDQGEVLLWRAEFALGAHPQRPSNDPEKLFRAAQARNLSAADQVYVQGMLAETSPDAVKLFKQVLEIDPFHHRARGMLVNLLFTLARLEEAHQQLSVSIQLFPEDQYFKLMDGLAWAAEGKMSECFDVVQRAKLGDADATQWRYIFETVDRILSQGVATDRPQQLVATLLRDQSSTQFLELVRHISDKPYATGLHLPPRVHKKFTNFREIVRLVASASIEKTKFLHDLEQIVEAHPEGALFYFLGEVQIAENQFVAARNSFERSLQRPSLLRGHRHLALMGVAATSVHLAYIRKENVQENLKHAVSAIQRMDIEEYVSAEYCRTFAITTITMDDLKLGRVWLEKWAAADGADQRDVLRNLISLEFLESDHIAALNACERLLKLDSKHPYALEHRAKALEAIKKRLPADDGAQGKAKHRL